MNKLFLLASNVSNIIYRMADSADSEQLAQNSADVGKIVPKKQSIPDCAVCSSYVPIFSNDHISVLPKF